MQAQLAPNDTATMMPPTTNTGPPVGGLPAGVTMPVSNINSLLLYLVSGSSLNQTIESETLLTLSVAT